MSGIVTALKPCSIPPRVESALDAIVESYGEGKAIDNLAAAALPNERSCVEVLRALEPVLYMGFYAIPPLHRGNLRDRIAEHLAAVYAPLVYQIERAIGYEDFRTHLRIPPPGSGETIVRGLFEKLPQLRRTLEGDVRAAYDGDPAAASIEEVVFSYPSITALTAYRIARCLHLEGVPLIPRILTEHAHAETGIDIHPGADIGERIFIDHGTGVVIGATAQLGNDIKLYQGVTLGALSVPGRSDLSKRHPTLEDGVTVYAGATILGGDTVIGARSVIGGNVWLTRSVPPDSKVFGGSKGSGSTPINAAERSGR